MTEIAYPLSRYQPGRFSYLMDKPEATEIWNYVAQPDHIAQMVQSSDNGTPAIWPIIEELENRFERFLTSPDILNDDAQILVNNMIKQIMEFEGYEHSACGICRHARHIKSSGMYVKRPGAHRKIAQV